MSCYLRWTPAHRQWAESSAAQVAAQTPHSRPDHDGPVTSPPTPPPTPPTPPSLPHTTRLQSAAQHGRAARRKIPAGPLRSHRQVAVCRATPSRSVREVGHAAVPEVLPRTPRPATAAVAVAGGWKICEPHSPADCRSRHAGHLDLLAPQDRHHGACLGQMSSMVHSPTVVPAAAPRCVTAT